MSKPRHNPHTYQSPPSEWCRKFLPDMFDKQGCIMHGEMFRDAFRLRGNMARVAPRGHGKSTTLSVGFPLWCVCEQRKRHILIVAAEASQACRWARDIRENLESNPLIIDKYGKLASDEIVGTQDRRGKWTEAQFVTTSGIVITARGFTGKMRGLIARGQRPDLVICDDIEDEATLLNKRQRDKAEHRFRRVIMCMLADEDSSIIVAGTLLHFDSLLSKIMDPAQFKGVWNRRTYRAIGETETDIQGDGEVLWRAAWPMRRLEAIKIEIGSLAFEQEFQGHPADETARLFKPKWMIRHAPMDLERETITQTVMAVDPATGKTGGDYFAICVASMTERGICYVRELTLHRIGFVEQVKLVIATFMHWNPSKVGIETVAYQQALREAIDHASRQNGLFIPVVEIKNADRSKQERIASLAPIFERRDVSLPDLVSDKVIEQFIHYPLGRHDDAPDALEMCIRLMRPAEQFCWAMAGGDEDTSTTPPPGETPEQAYDRRQQEMALSKDPNIWKRAGSTGGIDTHGMTHGGMILGRDN